MGRKIDKTKPETDEPSKLLQRLIRNTQVVLKMRLKGFMGWFEFWLTSDDRLLVVKNNDFLIEASSTEDAVRQIAKIERQGIHIYKNLEVIYKAEEQGKTTKLDAIHFPRQFSKRTGMEMHGERFYIAKKGIDGKTTRFVYCLYNWRTRNLLNVHWDKEVLLAWLAIKYPEVKHKDKEEEDE